MATEQRAITIAINPKTNLKFEGKWKSWGLWSTTQQTDFLDSYLFDVERTAKVLNYVYEKTDKGNIHLHARIEIRNDEEYQHVKTKLFTLTRTREAYRQRVWNDIPCYDQSGWDAYLSKTNVIKVKRVGDDEVSDDSNTPDCCDQVMDKLKKKLF